MPKSPEVADVLAKPFYDQFTALQNYLGIGALVIIVVVVVVAIFAMQYIKDKASQLATRENLSDRIEEQTRALEAQRRFESEHFAAATRQLAETTQVIKSIEKKFDFENWHMKEKNQLLRVKLEEATFACAEAVQGVCAWSIALRSGDGSQPPDHHGFGRMSSLLSLYFPTLFESGLGVQTAGMALIDACYLIRSGRVERINIDSVASAHVADPAVALTLSRPTATEEGSTRELERQFVEAEVKFRHATRELMQSLLPS